ncbi:hypothetical protein P8452_31289 [Trifolium repens]|nr:hypothetical protein QL285_065716 [Trifolium repens]WJX44295.1 hypothetical protein P8452_31289 [Trifolium repens]
MLAVSLDFLRLAALVLLFTLPSSMKISPLRKGLYKDDGIMDEWVWLKIYAIYILAPSFLFSISSRFANHDFPRLKWCRYLSL